MTIGRKLTQQQIDKRNSDAGIKMLGEYIDIDTKTTFECPFCQSIFEVAPYSIWKKKDPTVSCGCYRKRKASEALSRDLSNKKFWKLTAIKDVGSKNHSRMWLCRCDCGKEIVLPTKDLTMNRKKSCGCVGKISYGEKEIKYLLDSYGVNFVREKAFDKCRSEHNRCYKFDFYLPDYNLCIEYNGIQHYEPFSFRSSKTSFNKKVLNLKDLQFRDKYKRDFCKRENIPLLEISYLDYEEIPDILTNALQGFFNV